MTTLVVHAGFIAGELLLRDRRSLWTSPVILTAARHPARFEVVQMSPDSSLHGLIRVQQQSWPANELRETVLLYDNEGVAQDALAILGNTLMEAQASPAEPVASHATPQPAPVAAKSTGSLILALTVVVVLAMVVLFGVSMVNRPAAVSTTSQAPVPLAPTPAAPVAPSSGAVAAVPGVPAEAVEMGAMLAQMMQQDPSLGAPGPSTVTTRTQDLPPPSPVELEQLRSLEQQASILSGFHRSTMPAQLADPADAAQRFRDAANGKTTPSQAEAAMAAETPQELAPDTLRSAGDVFLDNLLAPAPSQDSPQP